MDHADISIKGIQLRMNLRQRTVFAKVVHSIMDPVARRALEREVYADNLPISPPDVGVVIQVFACVCLRSQLLALEFTPETWFLSGSRGDVRKDAQRLRIGF